MTLLLHCYTLSRTDITTFFVRGNFRKIGLSNQSEKGNETKKPREGSLEESQVLNSSALVGAFTNSLKAPKCVEIFINCFRNVESQMK